MEIISTHVPLYYLIVMNLSLLLFLLVVVLSFAFELYCFLSHGTIMDYAVILASK